MSGSECVPHRAVDHVEALRRPSAMFTEGAASTGKHEVAAS
jgi:hypothetical protein